MNVRLVSYSRAHDNEDLSGIEDLVAYCARVSSPSNQDNKATNNKLIKYLIKHKHFSPFEMVNICVEIETTRDIGRQILRHRSFSFQEFSQRYADPTRDLSFEIREARMQDPKNRQNSVKTDDGLLQHAWADLQQKVIDTALEAYNFAVDNGIAKEQARVVLPEGNTMSRLYVNGTLRSWIHYIELREGVETQLEHREIAIAIAEAISQVYPLIKTGE
jgi:thymidylate synthase (FAD)